MSLIPWRRQALTPWFDMNSLLAEFDRPFSLAANGDTTWWPAVDIDEDDKSIVIAADLPDMNRKDIDVAVESGYLTLRGERKSETKDENKKHRRIERSYGAFERSFSLPENVNEKKISADYKNGVLKVTIPKTKAKPAEEKQTIPVS